MVKDEFYSSTSFASTLIDSGVHNRTNQRNPSGSLKSKTQYTLIEQYLPLVRSVLGRLSSNLPRHVDLEELHSAGLIGLLNAIQNFKQKNSATFGAYARIRIRGSIIDELRRMDWFPRPLREKAQKVQTLMSRLEQLHGRSPTDEEMAEALKLPLVKYRRLLDEIQPATFVSLDASISTGQFEANDQYESIPDLTQENPIDGASRNELAEIILERIKLLPEIQRKVLTLYYFDDLRLREIAEAFNLTESRICQIHSQAIFAIKAYIEKYES